MLLEKPRTWILQGKQEGQVEDFMQNFDIDPKVEWTPIEQLKSAGPKPPKFSKHKDSANNYCSTLNDQFSTKTDLAY
jgi:hypothetical protein